VLNRFLNRLPVITLKKGSCARAETILVASDAGRRVDLTTYPKNVSDLSPCWQVAFDRSSRVTRRSGSGVQCLLLA
jgi:hypothetical protein